MALGSHIEWTDATWNPITGCTKVGLGCKHCYAERMARRLQAMGSPNYHNGFRVTLHEHMLEVPLAWGSPRTVFVNSMSDLFHEAVPLGFIQRVFETMRRAHRHRFQVLTKRADRLAKLSRNLEWAENIWMGVSVENESYTGRIQCLRSSGAHIKFLSLEPLLAPLHNLDFSGIDWVIVGGESGPGARPMHESWVVDIRNQCLKARVPFFFKQWGGTNKRRSGRLLLGRTWSETPLALPA